MGKEDVVKVPRACNERRAYDERHVIHGDKRTEGVEELRKGGPFPMATELVDVGVVRGLWLLGEVGCVRGRRGRDGASRDAARHARSQASRYRKGRRSTGRFGPSGTCKESISAQLR